MEGLTAGSCAHGKAVSPHNGENKWGRISISYKRIDQYPSFPALEASAAEGCGFCGLLRYALQDKYSEEKIAEAESDFHQSIRARWPPASQWNGQVTVEGARFSTEDDWPERDTNQTSDQSLGGVYALSLGVWPYPPRRSDCEPESNRSLVWFAVYADTDSKASLQGASRRRKPDKEALSDANVSLISEWLSDCSRLHGECRHKACRWLPTRVIDVGPADGSQAPCLIVPLKESGDYVALSHCWGSLMESDVGNYARTLKKNIHDMRHGILLEKLPQNFQDAILTDEPADWAMEAAKMNHVYGSAYLTIAATSATSSTDGFLKRSQEMASRMPYSEDNRGQLAENLLVVYQRTGGNQGSWFSNIERARWNTRGWTFQERLLSKRVLHFTERNFFWECRATDASEENEPPRNPMYRTPWLKDEDPAEHGSLTAQNAGASEPRFDLWYSIVSRYSARELSRETDALPALSGLAHAFGAIHGMGNLADDDDDYFSGIWREDLARGLLWTPHDSSKTSRCGQYVAPTWSWASIKGQVHFPSRGLSAQITPSLVGISPERRADNHLGAIVGAKLTLLAKVRRLCEVVRKTSDSWYPLDLRVEGKTVGNGAFDLNSESVKNTLWIMECMLQKALDFREDQTLLLVHSSDNTPSTYERVGVGRMTEDSLGFFSNCEPQEIALI